VTKRNQRSTLTPRSSAVTNTTTNTVLAVGGDENFRVVVDPDHSFAQQQRHVGVAFQSSHGRVSGCHFLFWKQGGCYQRYLGTQPSQRSTCCASVANRVGTTVPAPVATMNTREDTTSVLLLPLSINCNSCGEINSRYSTNFTSNTDDTK